MDKYIGKLLDNRYEILEKIGCGGMSTVYKARCHRLNRFVAIKILKEDLAQDEEFRRRFHDESRAVAMLSHPNIVAVYDVSRSSDIDYIVMELIEGITLKQYMQQKGNQLNWREALHFIIQITKALGHAHSRGIIHRDIKPHNIMVLKDGSVKVADFGIARLINANHSTLTQEALGSVHYISPEQARGSHIDARSDLYSAGIVLYEMLTGRLPFEGDSPVSVAIQHINSIPLTPRELNPDIPEALEEITMKAMAPNPDKRYLSADDMLADLEEFRKNPNINFDYGVDTLIIPDNSDEPTQVVNNVAGMHRISREPVESDVDYYDDSESLRRPRRRTDRERREAGGNFPMAAAVIVILLFVGGLFAFLWFTFLSPLMRQEPTYQVPQITGYTLEEIALDTSILNGFELNPEVVKVESDEPVGTILVQDPEASRMIKGEENLIITVTVSGGKEDILMPEVYNQEVRSTTEKLKAMGLIVLPVIEEYSDITQGYITRYTPQYGSVVKEGDEVQLWVSKGPEPPMSVVPSVIDLTLERATSLLHSSNLEVGQTEEVYDATILAGRVVYQDPGLNETVEEGTKVNLKISKGPDPSTLPPAQAVQEIPITLPDVDGVVVVRIDLDGVKVFEESVDCTMETAIMPSITGAGTQNVSIYFDDVFQETRVVTFS